jgi:hypothetical protein
MPRSKSADGSGVVIEVETTWPAVTTLKGVAAKVEQSFVVGSKPAHIPSNASLVKPIVPPKFVNGKLSSRSKSLEPVKSVKLGSGTNAKLRGSGPKPGSTPVYVVLPNVVPAVVTMLIALNVFVTAS